MITFEPIPNQPLAFFDDRSDSTLYVFKKDDTILGYGRINSDLNDRIELFIFTNYRGNGYGKQLFGYLIKSLHFTYITVTFEERNVLARRIVENYGGELSSINKGIVRYIVPSNLS